MTGGLKLGSGRSNQDTFVAATLPARAVFTGDGVLADPIGANEANTYTNEGSTYTHEGKNNFRMHNCVGVCVTGDRTHALTTRSAAEEDGTGRGNPIVNVGMAVRRLTPVECERLQGFPDDYTDIPWKGKPAGQCPDGPRYKALGNSMAVPVIRWIGLAIGRSL